MLIKTVHCFCRPLLRFLRVFEGISREARGEGGGAKKRRLSRFSSRVREKTIRNGARRGGRDARFAAYCPAMRIVSLRAALT